ncbi:hypothetical protein SORBI_3006G017500 [Sorghum bicolor]|uniref:Disease resistance protein At4g27190-like leucine-rich repeats domain-containing protein n=1 Tax=Sorghum bicolor TaxID=4558 RepID=C5YC85_SORBI|nr:hypothetical protein SORBI_3006G017500 [Sorghum bicolor]
MQEIFVHSVGQAVDRIIPYLESTAHKAVYFEGWNGLAASAVLRAIADRPPPSLTKKFDKIIHIDCSRWKSRRDLQRAIVDELKLPGYVVAQLDRQDEEDDFLGVEQASRAEIRDVTREIYQTLRDVSRMLVIFHNGSDNMVDMADLGILHFDCRLLWTFRGRFRLNKEIQKKVDSSHLFVDASRSYTNYNELIKEEAREITLYAHKNGITPDPDVVRDCCMYLLSLNYYGGSIMDYSWATHASNYWVCDGIVGDKDNQAAWDVAGILHQEIRLEDYSSSTLPVFGDELSTPPGRWILLLTSSDMEEKAYPETTSLFLAPQRESDQPLPSLPNDMFQQADQLRVLKLCGCTFKFSSPPFHCCYNLRFLGLDSCMDQENLAEPEKEGAVAMEIFQRLWVLDVCQTDWELAFPEEIQEQVATDIREVHVRKGRIWRKSLAWRQLQNLHKLRVIEPTGSWETGKKDEFTDMIKLELLHLSGNNSIQVLPSLCGATGLKTLVLDGCVGLDHIGPEGIPPSLESFSLDGGAGKDGKNPAKLSRITLVDCAKLVDFTLLGSLPNLEELDLSRTTVKTVNLKMVVPVKKLGRIFLMGCQQLRAIIWPENGMKQLRLLRIDTRQGVAVPRETSYHSIVCHQKEGYRHAHVSITDIRFLPSLVLTESEAFCWSTAPFKLDLYLSCSINADGENCNSKKMDRHFYSTGQIVESAPKSFIHKTYSTYNDVSINHIVTENDDDSGVLQFEPQGIHVEMGQELVDINVLDSRGIRAIIFVMNKVQSFHMCNNSSITTVIPERMLSSGEDKISWDALKWCHVQSCPKLKTVFTTNYNIYCFKELETIWVADLLMASSIWSRGRIYIGRDTDSFAKLRAIHLYRCPRLRFVLPLSWFYTLSSLETLHIIECSDLRQVFPVEAEFLNEIATKHPNGMLEFPMLKDLYLYHLSSLRQICEAKIFAPKLETVRLRGCWGLKRLPATKHRRHNALRVVVDCEKDWWDSLEWDGLDFGHHPSLFAPSHSSYYKKQMLRGAVLR